MAVQRLDVASSGEAGDEDAPLFAEINITPFTDVILVLLIIFMVSSSAMVDAAREGHLEVTLPQAGHAAHPGEKAQTLVLGLAADGRIFVHGHFISEEELATVLQQTHADAPGTTVIVDADGELSHHAVVQVIDRVRSAGFPTVGIGAAADP
jgi:biopolymer transport protein ExbD